MAYYTGGYLVLDDTSNTVLGGVTQIGVQTGAAAESRAKSGEPYARTVGLTAIAPTFSVASTSVGAYIDALGLSGYNIANLETGAVLYCAQAAPGGQRKTGSVHKSYTVAAGIIVPTTITASQDSAATIEYSGSAIYDGANAPLTITENVALPTAPTSDVEYDLAGWTIAGAAVDGIQSVSIEFGYQVEALRTDGATYPTFAYIKTMEPRVRITTMNLDAAIDLVGEVGTQANTVGYLRKRAVGTGHVSDATAEHISISCAGVAHMENALSVNGTDGSPGTMDIVITVYYDGTNAPFTVDTTSAIS